MRNQWKAVLAMVILTACASQRAAMRFARDGMLIREAIELHPDGTLVYRAFSDDGPTVFSAHGTWRWVVARKVERGYLSAADDLPDVVVWRAARNALQRPNRPPMHRKPVAASGSNDCDPLRPIGRRVPRCAILFLDFSSH